MIAPHGYYYSPQALLFSLITLFYSLRCFFIFFYLFFFFASRRRHTRFKCDWSYVCSSDLGALLRGDGHTVTDVGGASDAVAAVAAAPFDLVITGQKLSDGEGLEVLSACQDADLLLPVV